MPSFRISISPSRRAAARFVTAVRRKILAALEEESLKRGLKQTDIARTLGVHRSVINRELRGKKDITLGRVAEIASAMGRVAVLEFPEAIIRKTTALVTETNANTDFDFKQFLNVPVVETNDNDIQFIVANDDSVPTPRIMSL